MRQNEFLRKIERECSHNVLLNYKKFMYYQTEVIRTLNEVKNICKSNEIPYQLAYGTLLGAIRDDGQIPWDYDADIFVPYNYRKKLLLALERELGEKFHYASMESNDFRSYIVRVAPKGFDVEYLHLDIFFLIGAPDDDKERKKFSETIVEQQLIRYYKKVRLLKGSRYKVKAFCNILWNKLRCLKYEMKEQDCIFEGLCTKYDISQAKYCVSADTFSSKRSYPIGIFNTTTITIREHEYAIPQDYDEILTLIYKDYNKSSGFIDCIDEFEKALVWLEKAKI